MKVLQVFGGLNCGGAETMLMNLYRKVDKETFQFGFVKHTESTCFYDEEIRSLGGEIFSCPKYFVLNHFAYKRWWKKFFAKHKEYRVVHSHVRSTASIILKVAKKQGLKTIAHSHSTSNGSGLKSFFKGLLQKNIKKWANVCLACSKESGQWLFGVDIVNNEKFRIFPNAIDLEKFSFNATVREEIREKYKLENCFVLGHVGRFSTMKNHLFIVEVFKKIQEEKENSRLMLLGDGILKREIMEQVEKNGLSEKVIFVGTTTNVAGYMSAMDCFVFPSTWEGLPVTLVEAQANGLPIVASDVITDEVNLSSLLEKMSLKEGAANWAKKILSVHREVADNTEIQFAGFDINYSVKMLQDTYLV